MDWKITRPLVFATISVASNSKISYDVAYMKSYYSTNSSCKPNSTVCYNSLMLLVQPNSDTPLSLPCWRVIRAKEQCIYVAPESRRLLGINGFSVLQRSPLNPLKPELNPICYLLALLGAYHFLHVSRIRVTSLTFRLLMSYIYGAPILDVSRSHTTTQHSR